MRTKFIILLAFLAVNSVIYPQQILDEKYQKIITPFVTAVRNNDKDAIIKQIKYPLIRRHPLPDVNDAKEMSDRFNEIFDDSLINEIKNSSIELDWHGVGWRGITLNAGTVWIDYDGTVYGIPLSEEEEKIREKIIMKDRETLYPPLREFVEPMAVYKSSSCIIRIDKIGDNNYRAAFWKKNREYSNPPEFILENGSIELQGSIGDVVYQFIDGDKKYVILEPHKYYGFLTGKLIICAFSRRVLEEEIQWKDEKDSIPLRP